MNALSQAGGYTAGVGNDQTSIMLYTVFQSLKHMMHIIRLNLTELN